jgi:hypothetical protein
MTAAPQILFAQRVRYSAIPNLHVVELFNDQYMIGRGYSVETETYDSALNALRREVRGLKNARVLWITSDVEQREGHPH